MFSAGLGSGTYSDHKTSQAHEPETMHNIRPANEKVTTKPPLVAAI